MLNTSFPTFDGPELTEADITLLLAALPSMSTKDQTGLL